MKPDKLCERGCGFPAPIAQRTNSRQGCVKGQPQRFIIGHRAKRHIPDYILSDTLFFNGTPCWIWNRNISVSTGYGCTSRGANAHRKIYESMVGPIPRGLELDHLCRNRACVNPAHLEPVTHKINSERSPLLTVGHISSNRKLTPDQVRYVRKSSLSHRQLAADLGVSKPTIRLIKLRVQYKEVTD